MATIVGCRLPDPYYGTVESIRDDLVDEFGVDEYPNLFPHFTLYALPEDVDVVAVEAAIEAVAEAHAPFSVRTDGIGVFPGNVVWLPVARSPRLADLHSNVVRAVADLGPAPEPYYDPSRWFPHVGFALDLDDERTGDVVEFLLEYDLAWEFTADNITITRPPAEGERHEVVASLDL